MTTSTQQTSRHSDHVCKICVPFVHIFFSRFSLRFFIVSVVFSVQQLIYSACDGACMRVCACTFFFQHFTDDTENSFRRHEQSTREQRNDERKKKKNHCPHTDTHNDTKLNVLFLFSTFSSLTPANVRTQFCCRCHCLSDATVDNIEQCVCVYFDHTRRLACGRKQKHEKTENGRTKETIRNITKWIQKRPAIEFDFGWKWNFVQLKLGNFSTNRISLSWF